MPYMEWVEAMSVGVPELDGDHKMLIRVINQLARGAEGNPDPVLLRQSIVGLMRYTQYHFAREERVMAACGFPHMGPHKDEHRNFVDEIQAVAKRFEEDEQGAAGEVNEELLGYLKDWLNHHILIVDKAYRPYAEGKTAARKAAQAFKAAEIWWGS